MKTWIKNGLVRLAKVPFLDSLFLRLFVLINDFSLLFLRRSGLVDAIYLRGSFLTSRFVPFISDIDLAIVQSGAVRPDLEGADKFMRKVRRVYRMNPLIRDRWQTILSAEQLPVFQKYWYLTRLEEWRLYFGKQENADYPAGSTRLLLAGLLTRQYLWTQLAAFAFSGPRLSEQELFSAAKKAAFFFHLIQIYSSLPAETFSREVYTIKKERALRQQEKLMGRRGAEPPTEPDLFFEVLLQLSASVSLVSGRYGFLANSDSRFGGSYSTAGLRSAYGGQELFRYVVGEPLSVSHRPLFDREVRRFTSQSACRNAFLILDPMGAQLDFELGQKQYISGERFDDNPLLMEYAVTEAIFIGCDFRQALPGDRKAIFWRQLRLYLLLTRYFWGATEGQLSEYCSENRKSLGSLGEDFWQVLGGAADLKTLFHAASRLDRELIDLLQMRDT